MKKFKKLDSTTTAVFVVIIHYGDLGFKLSREQLARVAQESLQQPITFNDSAAEYRMWDYISEAADNRNFLSPTWVEAWKIKPCRYMEINLLM